MPSCARWSATPIWGGWSRRGGSRRRPAGARGRAGALRPLVPRVGKLAGAATAVATSRAIDALQAVIWSAVRDELRRPDPDMVSEVSERLAAVRGRLPRAG